MCAWKRGTQNNLPGAIRKGHIKEYLETANARDAAVKATLLIVEAESLPTFRTPEFTGCATAFVCTKAHGLPEALWPFYPADKHSSSAAVVYLHAHEYPKCVIMAMQHKDVPQGAIVLNQALRLNCKVCTGERQVWRVFHSEQISYDAREGAIGNTALRTTGALPPCASSLLIDLRVFLSPSSSSSSSLSSSSSSSSSAAAAAAAVESKRLGEIKDTTSSVVPPAPAQVPNATRADTTTTKTKDSAAAANNPDAEAEPLSVSAIIDGQELASAFSRALFGSIVTQDEVYLAHSQGRFFVGRIAEVFPEASAGNDGDEENEEEDDDDENDEERERERDENGSARGVAGGSAMTGGGRAVEVEDLTLTDNYRGLVDEYTATYFTAESHAALGMQCLQLVGDLTMPRQPKAKNTVYIRTTDDEIFPVKRRLLRPCIALTAVVQAGKGKYKHISSPTLTQQTAAAVGDLMPGLSTPTSTPTRPCLLETPPSAATPATGISDMQGNDAINAIKSWKNQELEEHENIGASPAQMRAGCLHNKDRSETLGTYLARYGIDNAPEDAQIADVAVDACTFDRVLLYLEHEARQEVFTFDPLLVNELLDAAEILQIAGLRDVCQKVLGSFEERVRKTPISLDEVNARNAAGAAATATAGDSFAGMGKTGGKKRQETWLMMSGMVLDISRWLDEHPGGSTIIPEQALGVDCTVFFEIYHASRQSFLYLKEFYIGELALEDRARVPLTREERLGVKQQPAAADGRASEAFLQQLDRITSPWRLDVHKMSSFKEVHKSF